MRDDAALLRLIAETARGDERALKALYERTAPKLFGIILRIQRDRSTAEDTLQEVYLRVWQAAGSYAPGSGPPLPWLCAIARNRAIDSVRRKGAIQGSAGADGTEWMERIADPHDSEGAILGRDALRACLDRLDARQRDCIVLAYCEGYSREELAARHDRPVNTIKTWLHRGLSSLRGCLEAIA